MTTGQLETSKDNYSNESQLENEWINNSFWLQEVSGAPLVRPLSSRIHKKLSQRLVERLKQKLQPPPNHQIVFDRILTGTVTSENASFLSMPSLNSVSTSFQGRKCHVVIHPECQNRIFLVYSLILLVSFRNKMVQGDSEKAVRRSQAWGRNGWSCFKASRQPDQACMVQSNATNGFAQHSDLGTWARRAPGAAPTGHVEDWGAMKSLKLKQFKVLGRGENLKLHSCGGERAEVFTQMKARNFAQAPWRRESNAEMRQAWAAILACLHFASIMRHAHGVSVSRLWANQQAICKWAWVVLPFQKREELRVRRAKLAQDRTIANP